ncbi:hypothetical protein ASPZODRAFT_76785 [Penicilliopsis zonata CBS 506.65]|uniref:N-acetyltransferase domain-containing protein n=1 Tax=Penicilliopsis zonata CBS 506.65 TaxID=1073090 RepID=A0A1L9S5P6_9EURO|nr:hypothetical protein ASPZODRAFT_76785 [Penicilliopsis zonata CBS 506.65]OJJ42482.1 hypothetical protein ASPZODRAFT_76785 [Penicilliopsis zonata CBS 506.65]
MPIRSRPYAQLSNNQPRAQTNRAVAAELLRRIDSTQQIQQFLHEFHPSQGNPLAVIAIGPDTLSSPGSSARAQLERLAESLAFLRRVGLFPVIVHGDLHLDDPEEPGGYARPPADQSNRLRRIRSVNYRVSALLERRDVDTRPITCGIFTAAAEPGRPPASDQGIVTAIAPDAIDSAVRAGSIPVVAALGTSAAQSRTHALDAHHAALHLARVLQPLRSIFLRPDAALQPPASPGATAVSATALQALAHELGPSASVLLGAAPALSSAIFPDAEPWTVIRSPRTIRVVTAIQDFPSRAALHAALQRHLHHLGTDITVDMLLSQLETRDFIAYFDHDPSEGSPTATDQTINNLALVFPRASFPWKPTATVPPTLPPRSSNPVSPAPEKDRGGQGDVSELALFAISQPGWLNGAAEQFWDRIRADHVSLWGSLGDTHPSLPWWLSRSSGCVKRGLEGRVYLWYGLVA